MLEEGVEGHLKPVRGPYPPYIPPHLPPLHPSHLHQFSYSLPHPVLVDKHRTTDSINTTLHLKTSFAGRNMSSKRPRQPAMPGKFTSSGKPRQNMVGSIGLASEARKYLCLDAQIRQKDGSKGYHKWGVLRSYIKQLSGDKLWKRDYTDAEYLELYSRCASHALLEPVKDKLTEPPSYLNRMVQDSLHWCIEDAWKKKRMSARKSGENDADYSEDEHEHVNDGGDSENDDAHPEQQSTIKKRRKMKASTQRPEASPALLVPSPPTTSCKRCNTSA